jgi:hypothetical protein
VRGVNTAIPEMLEPSCYTCRHDVQDNIVHPSISVTFWTTEPFARYIDKEVANLTCEVFIRCQFSVPLHVSVALKGAISARLCATNLLQ